MLAIVAGLNAVVCPKVTVVMQLAQTAITASQNEDIESRAAD
jgi:hypothetical protein